MVFLDFRVGPRSQASNEIKLIYPITKSQHKSKEHEKHTQPINVNVLEYKEFHEKNAQCHDNVNKWQKLSPSGSGQ
jgi:hypothetical protein